jgi:hypothetical protein
MTAVPRSGQARRSVGVVTAKPAGNNWSRSGEDRAFPGLSTWQPALWPHFVPTGRPAACWPGTSCGTGTRAVQPGWHHQHVRPSP